VGLVPDEMTANGARLHMEPPPADDRLDDEDGMLVIPAAESPISDDLVRALRDAGQASQMINAQV
jgi:hypothetical protein